MEDNNFEEVEGTSNPGTNVEKVMRSIIDRIGMLFLDFFIVRLIIRTMSSLLGEIEFLYWSILWRNESDKYFVKLMHKMTFC